MEENLVDDVIKRLLGAKNGKTTKLVQLTEAEIKHLCSTAKQIFLSQPNLLELEAPIKICGLVLIISRFRSMITTLPPVVFVLNIVEGKMQYLFDETGRRYLKVLEI